MSKPIPGGNTEEREILGYGPGGKVDVNWKHDKEATSNFTKGEVLIS